MAVGPTPERSVLQTEVAPFAISYYILAALVTLPDTRWIRIGWMAIPLYFAWKGMWQWDVVGGDPKLLYLNFLVAFNVCTAAMNVVFWGFTTKPLKRIGTEPSKTLSEALINGKALLDSPTGAGWEHGPPPRIAGNRPPEFQIPQPRWPFVLGKLAATVGRLFLFDIVHRTVVSCTNSEGSELLGFSLFVPSLPPMQRFLLASFLSVLITSGGVALMSLIPDVGAAISVARGADPKDLLSPFNQPWRATSLSSFWGYRWHQFVRVPLVNFGGRPLAAITGWSHVGLVMGTFIASGLAHEVGSARYPGSPPISLAKSKSFLFFVMMGVGVTLEHGWRRVTGRKVKGFAGGVWTFGWLIVWLNLYLDEATRIGFFGTQGMGYVPDYIRPSKIIWETMGWR